MGRGFEDIIYKILTTLIEKGSLKRLELSMRSMLNYNKFVSRYLSFMQNANLVELTMDGKYVKVNITNTGREYCKRYKR